MRISKIGHINLRVRDLERARHFYMDVLGFKLAERDPEHGGLFLTFGEDFHNFDISQHRQLEHAPQVKPGEAPGVFHFAFMVPTYADLRDAYQTLLDNGVAIDHATDHGNQRSLYLHDPDGNLVEIYYEMPDALEIFAGGRMDEDVRLPVTRPGEPLPDWLHEAWPAPQHARAGAHKQMAGDRRHPRAG